MSYQATTSVSSPKNDQSEQAGLHTKCMIDFYNGRKVCQICSDKNVLTDQLKDSLEDLIQLSTEYFDSSNVTSNEIHIDCLNRFKEDSSPCQTCGPQILYLKYKLSRSAGSGLFSNNEATDNFLRVVVFVSIIFGTLLYAPHYTP